MKALLLICSILVLSGCEAAPDESLNISTESGIPGQFINPAPSPSPSPAASPVARKSLLSSWARTDSFGNNNYTVDLSGLASTDLDSGPGIDVRYNGNNAVSFYFGTSRCISEVWITGTEDHGTLDVQRSNSGSAGVNATYCTPLVGVWDYVATVDGYRIQKGAGTPHEWR
jgi:hypothetical protein